MYGPSTSYRCRSDPQIADEVILTIASVGCSIRGSGTSSTRTSRLPCQVTAFMMNTLRSVAGPCTSDSPVATDKTPKNFPAGSRRLAEAKGGRPRHSCRWHTLLPSALSIRLGIRPRAEIRCRKQGMRLQCFHEPPAGDALTITHSAAAGTFVEGCARQRRRAGVMAGGMVLVAVPGGRGSCRGPGTAARPIPDRPRRSGARRSRVHRAHRSGRRAAQHRRGRGRPDPTAGPGRSAGPAGCPRSGSGRSRRHQGRRAHRSSAAR